MKEIWKKLDAWEGDRYISNYGRVKSLGNRTNNKKITYGSENNQGYMRIGLTKNGKVTSQQIHRLVMRYFSYDSDLQVNHIDGNKKNNKITNLEYVTCQQNHKHSVKNGLSPKGTKNGQSKLTKEKVLHIRNLYSSGKWSQDKLASKFNIGQTQISRIIRRESWGHV